MKRISDEDYKELQEHKACKKQDLYWKGQNDIEHKIQQDRIKKVGYDQYYKERSAEQDEIEKARDSWVHYPFTKAQLEIIGERLLCCKWEREAQRQYMVLLGLKYFNYYPMHVNRIALIEF